jgi:microbial collagenase
MKNAPVYQWIDFSSEWSDWQISSYFWDFGDGETSTKANPTHAYKKAWDYKVKLRLDFVNRNVLKEEIDISIY